MARTNKDFNNKINKFMEKYEIYLLQMVMKIQYS